MGICCCSDQNKARLQKQLRSEVQSEARDFKVNLFLMRKQYQSILIDQVKSKKQINLDIMKNQMLLRRIKSKPSLKLQFCYHFIDEQDLQDISVSDIINTTASTNPSPRSDFKFQKTENSPTTNEFQFKDSN